MNLLSSLCALMLASDPLPPPGGFEVRILRDLDVTWSDGYRTRLDVYEPRAPAPLTGWPMVLCLHGGQGSRKNVKVRDRAKVLARAGYVCFAYDTRGLGETPSLNPPGLPEGGEDQLRDAAESFYWVAAHAPGSPVDLSRLAMTGYSHGGLQTYWGAAFSGLPLPAPGTVITHFPVLSAVAPQVVGLDRLEELVPESNRVNADSAYRLVTKLGPTDPLSQLILAEDFIGLHAYLAADPLSDYLPAVALSEVPVLIMNTWDDATYRLTPIVNALPQLNPSVPHRFVVSTGIHGTPNNVTEMEFLHESTRQWFDVHLKGRSPLPVYDQGAEVAINPADPSVYLDESSLWAHQTYADWPPPMSMSTLYLRGSRELSPTPPGAPESGPTLRHRVAPGYGMADLIADQADPANVLGQDISYSFSAFDSAPLPRRVHLVGRPKLEVQLDTDSGTFQLHAALIDVDPVGSARYVAGGSAAVRDGSPGLHEVDLTLNDMCYVLEAGHVLRIQLENVALRRPPGQKPMFHDAPYFSDVDVTLLIDPADPPRLVLPVSVPAGFATPRMLSRSVSQDPRVEFDLDAGPERAGQQYFVWLTVQADGLGSSLLGGWLGSLGWIGQLDGSGRSRWQHRLDSQIAPSFAGTRWTLQMGAVDPADPWHAGPVEIILWD